MEAGEEIVITRRGFASLAGAWRGQVEISEDFDEFPADIAESLGMHP